MHTPIRRYGGVLIYHNRDAEGVIEIVDSHDVRALHFGTPPRQSAMCLSDPERVELAYVRAMLSALNFLEEPRRVLVLGLGGGTLARFLLSHYPACRIDAVERRVSVIHVAHDYFGLPYSERLAVHQGEAVEFIGSPIEGNAEPYDLILIDTYDERGMDASVHADAFFRNCARRLNPNGVLAINLWGTHAVSMRRSADWLRTYFPGRCFRLAVPNRGNIIGFGLGEGWDDPRPLSHKARAWDLQVRLGLEMPYFLRNLRTL